MTMHWCCVYVCVCCFFTISTMSTFNSEYDLGVGLVRPLNSVTWQCCANPCLSLLPLSCPTSRLSYWRCQDHWRVPTSSKVSHRDEPGSGMVFVSVAVVKIAVGHQSISVHFLRMTARPHMGSKCVYKRPIKNNAATI